RFRVARADEDKTVFEGKLKPIMGVKWGTNENHAELDFSEVRKEGRYVLEVGGSRSLPFRIGKEAYSDLPDQLLGFMREQRCGYNPWLDAVCHAHDGRTAFGPHTNGAYLDARGG